MRTTVAKLEEVLDVDETTFEKGVERSVNAIAVRGEVVDRPRLDQLATEVREGDSEVKQSLERALVCAINVGNALIEARDLLPQGTWTTWVEGECGVMLYRANYYMRIAHYQGVLPNGVNVSEAIDYIRGLPSINGASYVRKYPEALAKEARRRKSGEQTLQQIADDLGVSVGTVHRWCRPHKDSYKEKRRQRGLARDAKRALLREKAAQEAKRRGGSIDKAYSLLRQLSQELDNASRVEGVGTTMRRELRVAWSHVNTAETHLCTAIGVDYGSWRRSD